MYAQVVRLQHYLNTVLDGRSDVTVLEAGCGSGSHLQLDRYDYVVGIDISEQQLQRNTVLHEKILGDIQSYDLPRSRFDLIVCWDVLEHLPHPEEAIERFARAIKDDGVIILALPNVLSVKGLLTKLTPHWFHVWWYRTVFGQKHAGTQDYGPFKTFLRYSISPNGMRRLARRYGLDICYFSIYESDTQAYFRQRVKLVGVPWRLARLAVRGLTLGKVSPDLTDYIVVLRRSRSTIAVEKNRDAVASATAPPRPKT